MGTSKSYGAPTGGKWPPLKNEVTRYGSGGGGTPCRTAALPGATASTIFRPACLGSRYLAST